MREGIEKQIHFDTAGTSIELINFANTVILNNMDLENTGYQPEETFGASMDNELATQSELREPFDHNLIAQLEGKLPVENSKAKLFQNSFWNETSFESDKQFRKNRHFSDSNIDVDSFQAIMCSNLCANLESANLSSCKLMVQELKMPRDMNRTEKKIVKQGSPFMNYIKTKSGRKLKDSADKNGVFPSKFELDPASPPQNKLPSSRMIEEGGDKDDHDISAIEPLHRKPSIILGSNSEVNLYYVSNIVSQNNLANPDIGHNKFLKSSTIKRPVKQASMEEEFKGKMHHSEIMKLLNAVENVNHESNLPKNKSKMQSLNMILNEIGVIKKERKHSTLYQSLADKPQYWKPKLLPLEPKPTGMSSIELPILNKGSGSFVGRIAIKADQEIPQCELNRSPSSRPRTFTLQNLDLNSSLSNSRHFSVKDQLSRFDDDYQVIEAIGNSTLAGVFKCRNRLDGLNYAIKIYSHPVTSNLSLTFRQQTLQFDKRDARSGISERIIREPIHHALLQRLDRRRQAASSGKLA